MKPYNDVIVRVSTGAPADQSNRNDIAQLDGTQTRFIQAGAGSGKTTSLVNALMSLIEYGIDISHIAAITFTEKAALELRDRVRNALVQRANRVNQSAGQQQENQGQKTGQRRFQTALGNLDAAPIGTIHSFALRLLQENPLEAHVPPGVKTVDNAEKAIRQATRFETYRKAILDSDDPELVNAVNRCFLRANSGKEKKNFSNALDNVIKILDDSWDKCLTLKTEEETEFWDQEQAQAALRVFDEKMAECTDQSDKLYGLLASCRDSLSALVQVTPDDLNESDENLERILEAYRFLEDPGLKSFGSGKAWGGRTGKEVRDSFKELFADFRDNRGFPIIKVVHDQALILGRLQQKILEQSQLRQLSGELEYHDLLVLAKNLVCGADKEQVHARIREQYRVILIDEFQDTDPLQAEIALRIADPNGYLVESVSELDPEPGRLVVVGDPKQSIYRFRGADLDTYQQLKGQLARKTPDILKDLTVNFRSHPAILEWANSYCRLNQLVEHSVGDADADVAISGLDSLTPAPWFNDGHIQSVLQGPAVSYMRLSAQRKDELLLEKDPNYQPGQLTSKGEPKKVNISVDQARAEEGHRIAATILQAVGQAGDSAPWQKAVIRNQTSPSDSESKTATLSAVSLSDIAILIPTRTCLPILESCLDKASIPFVLESSSPLYSSQIVHDVMLCLRAIADTSDEATLVFALRTPLLGCSDVDLAEWRRCCDQASSEDEHFSAWNVYGRVPSGCEESPVAKALEFLQTLHRQIPVSKPADLLTQLIDYARLFEVANGMRNRSSLWNQLRTVVDQASNWYEQTGGSLREYLGWVDLHVSEDIKNDQVIVPDHSISAVHIMTIHSAKGREFPVVFVADSGRDVPEVKSSLLWFDPHSVGAADTACVNLDGFTTSNFERAKEVEKSKLEEEEKRLFYVAATRARDHLILSTIGQEVAKVGVYAELAGSVDAGDSVYPECPQYSEQDPPHYQINETVPQVIVPDYQEFLDRSTRARAASEQTSFGTVTEIAHSDATLPIQAVPVDAASPVENNEDTGQTLEELQQGESKAQRFFFGESALHGDKLGTTVHRALELVDFKDLATLDVAVKKACEENGLNDVVGLETVTGYCRRALKQDPMPTLIGQSTKTWKEMPIVFDGEASDGHAIQVFGTVDLMFQTAGGFVIVDYKTDISASEQTIRAYKRQVSSYMECVKSVTGSDHVEGYLIFCGPRPQTVSIQKV